MLGAAVSEQIAAAIAGQQSVDAAIAGQQSVDAAIAGQQSADAAMDKSQDLAQAAAATYRGERPAHAARGRGPRERRGPHPR